MESNQAATPTAAIPVPAEAAAVIELPTFVALDAPTWFRRAEIQFRLHRVPESRKADHVLAALPEEAFSKICRYLDENDALEYQTLKKFLLNRFTDSPSNRAARIRQLSQQPLGEEKATDAWIEMSALANLHPPIDMLKEMWLARLPDHVRAQLPDAAETPTNDLAVQAQRLIEAHNCASHYNACEVTGDHSPLPGDTHNAMQTRDEPPIDESINAVPQPRQHIKRNFPPLQVPRKFVPRYQTPQPRPLMDYQHQRRFTYQQRPPNPYLCRYHRNFGYNARNCQDGCTWPKNF